MYQKLLLLFTLALSLHASCTYNLNINFDFDNKMINVQSNIYDKQKSILINTAGFEIKNKAKLDEALNNGSNQIHFEYSKKIDSLNENYVYLLHDWYPQVKSQCVYTVQTNLAKNYKSIYEQTTTPIDHLTFVASKDFQIHQKKYNNILIQTYFLQKNKNLAQQYLDKTIEYIKLYEKKIGAYPYDSFKIVENIYQTGYSMPTYTLIGSRLLAKPYVLEQSLGHELLHQYFGNSIFANRSQGNWTEGLTTYLADDFYKKIQNKDVMHRKMVLNEFAHFVSPKNEFPINEFQYRHNRASMLIGYSKLSFVFHMLEEKLGTPTFDTLIKKLYEKKQFKEVNLKQLLSFFNDHTTQDLTPFFNQWIYQKGMIEFKIENIKNIYTNEGFSLSFDIVQNEKAFFKFDLPIEIKDDNATYTKVFPITKNKERIMIKSEAEILTVTLDKNYDLFRKLSFEEQPLAISTFLTHKNIIAVVDENDQKKYAIIKNIFPHANIVLSKDVKFDELKEHHVIFLDQNNSVLQYIFPMKGFNASNSYMVTKKHVYDKFKSMMIVHFGEYKSQYFRMLKHFSKYAQVIFTKTGGEKILDTTANGIILELNHEPMVQKIIEPKSIKNIVKNLEDKKVIYVSESHTNFGHHINQLRVIKELYKNNENIAIAMEMFQKPFQTVIDNYINHKISLNEFLKQTEYFQRWRFDYSLYKPIIDFAREKRIPIIAINIDRSITKKVSKKGLLSLSEHEKKLLPKNIDQSNQVYKKELESVFKEHQPPANTHHKTVQANLDYYYQSQLIWDEVMAENINEYMQAHPNKTMVVIAGSGHIKQHHGIPSRLHRLNTLDYAVILNDVEDTKDGDYLIKSHSHTTLPEQKKLGVYLKNPHELIVEKNVENSFAVQVGLQKGDRIIKINGETITTIYDIKRVLYFINNLKETSITIKRDDKILTLQIKE